MLEFGEPELIYDMPRIVMGGNLLNLGCCRGGSAILLARGLHDSKYSGRVWTVDIYPRRDLRIASKNIHDSGVEHLITQCRGTTESWTARLAKVAPFNFIFIDADHSYDGVKSDWKNYSPMLSGDGLIAFHDTNAEPVDKVIREEVEGRGWKQIIWVNRIKVYRRG